MSLPATQRRQGGPAMRTRLHEAVGVATEILARFGADPHEVFLGTVHAGHPGGMLPLTEASAPAVHDDRLPENVFVADATLFPRSLGNPPILTIIALAKRVARICAGKDAGIRRQLRAATPLMPRPLPDRVTDARP
jgi:choline dehydrogenase-like flavoprotein